MPMGSSVPQWNADADKQQIKREAWRPTNQPTDKLSIKRRLKHTSRRRQLKSHDKFDCKSNPTTMPIITILKYYPLFIIIIESRSLTRHVCLSINAEFSFLSQYRTHNCHNANGIEWEHEIIKCNKSEWKRENEKEERGAEPSRAFPSK